MTTPPVPLAKFPLVLLRWIDASEPDVNEDLSVDETPAPMRVMQCGFLIKNDDCSITIAETIKMVEDDVKFDHMITIPRCTVRDVAMLEIAGGVRSETCGNCEE